MNKVFESIKRGLGEAIEFTEGKPSKAVVHNLDAVDIKNIRSKVGMTQTEFASAFGISVSTLPQKTADQRQRLEHMHKPMIAPLKHMHSHLLM